MAKWTQMLKQLCQGQEQEPKVNREWLLLRGHGEIKKHRWTISDKGEKGHQEVQDNINQVKWVALYFECWPKWPTKNSNSWQAEDHKLKGWICLFCLLFSLCKHQRSWKVDIILAKRKSAITQDCRCTYCTRVQTEITQLRRWGTEGPRGERERYHPPCESALHSYDFLNLKRADLLYKNVESTGCMHPSSHAVHKHKHSFFSQKPLVSLRWNQVEAKTFLKFQWSLIVCWENVGVYWDCVAQRGSPTETGT